MALLFRGQENTPENPQLHLYAFVNETLTDTEAVNFRVYDITDNTKRTTFYSATTEAQRNPLQIFPATAPDVYDLDVTNLWTDVPPGHKLNTGHYYAPWTVPEDATPGSYIILWKYRYPGDAPGVFQQAYQEFVVGQANYFEPEENIGDDIRNFMEDHTSNNELIDGVEYTDRKIQRAIYYMINKYNTIAPRIGNYEASNFPDELKYLVLIGSAAHLMMSTSILQLRNQLTYTDGRVHVGLTDKHQLYRTAGKELMNEFDRLVKEEKIQRNLASAWGTVNSPYSGYYDFYYGSFG